MTGYLLQPVITGVLVMYGMPWKRPAKHILAFWDIKKYLPAETKSYVMNFIALNVLFNNYEKFSKNTLCFKPVMMKATDTLNRNFLISAPYSL